MENPESEQPKEELRYCKGDKCRLKLANLALNFRTASERELDDIVAGCWLDCKARVVRNNTEKYQPFLAKVLLKVYGCTTPEDRQVQKYLGYFDAQQKRDVLTGHAEIHPIQNGLDALGNQNTKKYNLEQTGKFVNELMN
jgi:hypothetical protein